MEDEYCEEPLRKISNIPFSQPIKKKSYLEHKSKEKLRSNPKSLMLGLKRKYETLDNNLSKKSTSTSIKSSNLSNNLLSYKKDLDFANEFVSIKSPEICSKQESLDISEQQLQQDIEFFGSQITWGKNDK